MAMKFDEKPQWLVDVTFEGHDLVILRQAHL